MRAFLFLAVWTRRRQYSTGLAVRLGRRTVRYAPESTLRPPRDLYALWLAMVGYAATRLTHPTLLSLGCRFNPEPGGVQRRQEQQGQGRSHHQAAHNRHRHRAEEHAA